MSRNSEPVNSITLPDILSTWVFFVILVIPWAFPGPLEVGYIASSGNDGLSSPCGVAYSELPEPCGLVKDEPAGGHEMTLPETNSNKHLKKIGHQAPISRKGCVFFINLPTIDIQEGGRLLLVFEGRVRYGRRSNFDAKIYVGVCMRFRLVSHMQIHVY